MTAALASVASSTPFIPRGAPARAEAWPNRPWFETPDLDVHLDRIGADEETRAFARAFAETGLGRIDLGEAGRALCDAVVADTDPYFERQGVTRVQDAWLRSRPVRKLATFPKVLGLLESAYGRPPFPFQTLNFQRGTQQSLHADAIHFHSEPARFMCGVWIALEDIAPESGPLAYVPGSHKLPILTMRGAGVNHDRPTYDDYVRTYVPALDSRLTAAGLPRTTAVIRKGEALVWAANLAHGGAPVTDPNATRRSLVVHYYFRDCVYYTPMLSDVEEGRLSVRLPVNALTGGWVWPRRHGRPAAPRLAAIAGAARKLLLRQPLT